MSFNGASLKHKRLLDLVRACSRSGSLDATKTLHALTLTFGPYSRQPIFLYNNVIYLYAGLGELFAARKVFESIPQRNAVTFNTVITAYSRCGDAEEALAVFAEMRGRGFGLTQHSLAGLLSCEALDLSCGIQLHGIAMKNGLIDADPFVGTALLNLYGRHGSLNDTIGVFEDMPSKSLVTWNSMLTLFGHHGYSGDCACLFRDIMRENCALSECTCMGILSGCSCEQDLGLGEQVHGLVIKIGFKSVSSIENMLMNMYVKCQFVCLAEKVFKELHVPDIVSWNIMIGAWAKTGKPEIALEIFSRMSRDGLLPNQVTFVGTVNACTGFDVQAYGEFMHAKIIRNAFESDVLIGSALVDFYVKFENLEAAHQCFNEIREKNVVSWTALISGYANRKSSTSLYLLQEMIRLGFQPNECSFSAVLKGSCAPELQQLHCLITKMGYECNDYVWSSLITSYTKNDLISGAMAFVTAPDEPRSVVSSNVIAGLYNRTGQFHETLKLLSALEEPDVVSWNIVIEACARSGNYREVFELFSSMQMFGVQPDKYTFVSLLVACCKLYNLATGSSVHGLMIKMDFSRCDAIACNVLMDMYGKCGCIGNTVKTFDGMSDRNIISWTLLISALGTNGYASDALERFREMESEGIQPDGIAFTAVLTACRHGRLVREGLGLFQLMNTYYKVEPEMDHYHGVVDLLAKNGHLKEAEEMIMSMPFPPNALVWRSFLDGCKRLHKNQVLELAE
ncbi:pentatricopeptide repeat-containing protein At3g58590 [Rhodamnia argentea]|uniref:Pentatricopeptide repeat-containing protein At3g58590 n=1 Tax=Rhodamnia argentea TaxID=178133 RepID=A0A8B8PUU9_9MYRT|nr:pentatricopeptide repeat-containing protein At3g58590 [Rhodamnia argentea]